MRLLYLIDSLVPGGAERSLAALAAQYVRQGVDLEVAYLHDRPGLQDELAEAGARLTCLARPGGRIGWLRASTCLVRERRPDLVHTTLFEADVSGRLAAWRNGRPVVSSLVNTGYGVEHAAEPGVRRLRLRGAQGLDALTARRAVRLHAVSGYVADVMAKRLAYPRDRVDVVARGRDGALLGRRSDARRSRARAALGVSPSQQVVLAAARHEPQKGIDVLLKAVALLRADCPDVVLLVAGRSGAHSAELHRLVAAEELGSSVRFLGHRDDVAELQCAADAFVLPSHREGMPGAVLEAMALETPIVASEIRQVTDVVDRRCAWLAPPGDAPAFAARLREVLREPRASAERTVRARRRFEDSFTIEAAAEGMLRFYDRALRRCPTR